MKTLEDVAREYLIDLLLKENRHTQSNIFCNYNRIDNEAYCMVEAEKLKDDYGISHMTDEKKDEAEYVIHIVKVVLEDKVIVNVIVNPKAVPKVVSKNE